MWWYSTHNSNSLLVPALNIQLEEKHAQHLTPSSNQQQEMILISFVGMLTFISGTSGNTWMVVANLWLEMVVLIVQGKMHWRHRLVSGENSEVQTKGALVQFYGFLNCICIK